MRIPLFAAALVSTAALLSFSASAQQTGGGTPPQPAAPQQQAAPPAPPTPYGLPIDLALARKAADAAVAKAKQTGFPSGIAIVDPAGELVFFEKMDNANNSVVELAQKKARSAAGFRRPTKLFEDNLSRPVITQLGVTAVGGGIPIVIKGHVVGAIGASGAPTSDGDIAAAQAGIDAITK
ncbi:MAG TPA: heme-binding protein [Stellaceae bacterium]|jgi:glc operon protein GlcG|nr:heme-binding protein [Stellaceae bacterium]